MILMGALFMAVRALVKAKDQRADDIRDMGTAMKDLNAASNTLVIETNRTMDSMSTKMEAHNRETEEMRRAINELEKQQALFVATAKQQGRG